MIDEKAFHKALCRFADNVSAKMTQLTAGEPEDQLRAPFENLMHDTARAVAQDVVCTGETRLPGRLGKPDYAIHSRHLLSGYVELKAPGTGANPNRYKGHNRDQWKRFQSIPNLIYCDGNEWSLYRSGARIGGLIHFSGDIVAEGGGAVSMDNAHALAALFTDYLSWEPIVPLGRGGKIDLGGFAGLLAPLCRMLRGDVTDSLKDAQSPLIQLAKDWRHLLFPHASDEQFADAYAQTVTFALLLARSEGAAPLTLESAEAALSAQHSLLSRALQVLTDPGARAEMSASLDLLLRVIAAAPRATLTDPEDPWLYFYEDFLAAYDPELRKNAGAYYTPVEVVRAQIRLVDDLLASSLDKPLGFADPGVVTLDPAAGTGTYLLGIIEHTLKKVKAEQGAGAVPGKATDLGKTLFGFEIMVGPYAVTELRVSRALRDHGATLPATGTNIFLTDTLESPNITPPQLPLFFKPIAEQHRKAIEVKHNVPVIVCIGNPPYDRHEAATNNNIARTGNWVRWGENGGAAAAIFRDFLDPAMAAGHGGDVKNLYNLYVYFWRWALWKVFEHKTASGPGIVSFISASSYLDGAAFCGMREHIRRVCDEVWIIDIGGEGRGARKTDNVFAIQTPVAIAVAFRAGNVKKNKPARVRYARFEGSRADKLKELDGIKSFKSVRWAECPKDWQAPFRPAGKGAFFDWPLLTNLMPWQHSGIECKRTWPIAVDEETLKKRWRALLKSADRAAVFRETEDRLVSGRYCASIIGSETANSISELNSNANARPIVRCGFRSFDRQHIIRDGRLMSRARPVLWQVFGEKQVYLASSFSFELSLGPGITACSGIPDLHYFSGRGGKDIIPLYRDAEAADSNILPGLLEFMNESYGHKIKPEDFAAYIYGIMAHPAYTEQFSTELETRKIRVPITKNYKQFSSISRIGARLLWLHTYGERFIPRGKRPGQIPRGKARCIAAVPGDPDGYPESFRYDDATKTLHVGDGVFRPVEQDVFSFEVSGLKVVQSWLKYRMKNGAGRKSSPLDDIRPDSWTSAFTDELLELLWVLEETVRGYPEQAALLEAVVSGRCFRADELPPVPDTARKAPEITRKKITNGELEFK